MRIENISKHFDGELVLEKLSFTLPERGITRVCGVSGSGKSTLLRIIAGLTEPDCGRVISDGERISYVFQEDRLLPWLSALDNVALCSDRRTAELWLRRVGLGDDMEKKPVELSGGMCRRVAIARALAFGGDVLLLDEPFTGLDLALRRDVVLPHIESFAREHPVMLVTHEQADVELLGDCMLLDITPQ